MREMPLLSRRNQERTRERNKQNAYTAPWRGRRPQPLCLRRARCALAGRFRGALEGQPAKAAALLVGNIGTDAIGVQEPMQQSLATSVPRLELKEPGWTQAGKSDCRRPSASEEPSIRKWHVPQRESGPHGWKSEH